MNGGGELTPSLVSDINLSDLKPSASGALGSGASVIEWRDRQIYTTGQQSGEGLSLGRPMPFRDTSVESPLLGPQGGKEKMLTIPQAQQDQGCDPRESH